MADLSMGPSFHESFSFLVVTPQRWDGSCYTDLVRTRSLHMKQERRKRSITHIMRFSGGEQGRLSRRLENGFGGQRKETHLWFYGCQRRWQGWYLLRMCSCSQVSVYPCELHLMCVGSSLFLVPPLYIIFPSELPELCGL